MIFLFLNCAKICCFVLIFPQASIENQSSRRNQCFQAFLYWYNLLFREAILKEDSRGFVYFFICKEHWSNPKDDNWNLEGECGHVLFFFPHEVLVFVKLFVFVSRLLYTFFHFYFCCKGDFFSKRVLSLYSFSFSNQACAVVHMCSIFVETKF